MKEVFNAAPMHPHGCLHSRFVAAEALRATLLLFTAALHVQMSHSTHKQQLHANITMPLLTRAGGNYIMSQALTSKELAWSSVTTPLALCVSWLCYGPHNLIHSFCHSAKRQAALAKHYRL